MQLNNEKTQLCAVEKILKEMEYTEACLSQWNCYWQEQYFNTVMSNDKNINRGNNGRKIPLKLVETKDHGYCLINTIKWSSIVSNHVIRNMEFNSDGNIILSKLVKRNRTNNHPTTIDYETKNNVLTGDFYIDVKINSLNNSDNIILALSEDVLIKKCNNMEVKHNLTTGDKQLAISRPKHKNTSIDFTATLDKFHNLVKGNFLMTIYDDKNVKGFYRLSVSKKGLRVNYYNRHGEKFDLRNNPRLIDTVEDLTKNYFVDNHSFDEDVICSFVSKVKDKVNHSTKEDIILNFKDFENAENEIVNVVKGIKGELPVLSLKQRIDYCLGKLKRNPWLFIDGEHKSKQKVKKFSTPVM